VTPSKFQHLPTQLFPLLGYSDFGPKYDQDNKGELISGIPMSVAPLVWSFVGVAMRPDNSISTLHMVCRREKINNGSRASSCSVNS